MAWTEQQQTAIEARGTSLIVSAAAGSGKTAVLTERLVQLIADPTSGVRADRMVVVTFTNDAASELKSRLDSKLRSMLNDRPDDAHLLKQQTLLQNAKICTINAFCFDLLRDNIADEGITSGFSVLDDTDDLVLRAQAMDELISWYTENDYETISYLYDKFCVKNESSFIEVITSVDSFLSSVTMSDVWLDRAVAEYKKPLRSTAYFKRFIAGASARLRRAADIANDCVSMIGKIFPDTENVPQAVKSLALAEEDLATVNALIVMLGNGELPTGEFLKFPSNVTVRDNVTHNKPLREIYKKKRALFIDEVKSVVASATTLEAEHAESAKVTEAVAGAVRRYQQLVWERKCEKNAISFDDGERLVLGMLASVDTEGNIVRTETAERISASYDIIMIDEYQDSNNKEDLIFKLLSKDYKTALDGTPMYGSNAFLVGDVKQSIYRFRLANPKNFIRTVQDSVPYASDSPSVNRSVFLNKNFRSSPEVIDFINFLFGQIMSPECGDIDYNEDEMLYFGAEEYTPDDSQPRKTHITLINDDEEAPDESVPKALRTSVNKEAVFTARRIADMLKNGTEVTCKDGTKRRCRPSDFGILVRTNAYINVYAAELQKLGVPVKGSEESGYLKAREIAVLTDLLRVIDNPLLDIPMAAVMTSPMYMFSIQELAYIRSLGNDRPIFTVLREICSGETECSDMFLVQRCEDFLASIDRFRLDSVTMTIGELISSIYDMTDFISVMQLCSDGDKKRANLRALIQYARSYEASTAFEGGGGLGGFLRHIDRVAEKKGDYSQGRVSAASGDHVTIQTLHGSKGLEYPFVFICETSHKFKFDSKTVMCSPDNMIGYVLYSPEYVRKYRTFQQRMLCSDSKRDTLSEEMRLLYVGLTRAKQQLFINLKCGEKALKRLSAHIQSCILRNGLTTDIIRDAASFSDWLWAGLIRHEAFAEIAEKLRVSTEFGSLPAPEHHASLFTYEIAENVVETDFEEADKLEEALPDDSLYAELTDIVHSGYDRTLSEMPSKLSVTQISKKFKQEDESFDFELKRPRFISDTKKLTGAERGTAIHTFFQYCDFTSAVTDADSEICRMVDMGYITPAQADSIDRENVAAFFRSDIYARMSSAQRVWREKKFMVAVSELGLGEMFRLSDGMIKGIVDLMFEENGSLVIVDYKSDRGVSAEKLRERYEMQLRLYKAAIELTSGQNVSAAYLYSFELQKTIEIEI